MTSTNTFYNKAKLNTVIAVGSTGISILLSTAITPLIVLSIGTENWARYAFFLLYVAALQCVEAALQAYSLQLNAVAHTTGAAYDWRRDGTLRKGMAWAAIVGAVSLGANYFTEIISDAEMRVLLSLAIVNVFPRALCAVLKGNMLGQQSQKQYYVATTTFNVARPLFLLLCLSALHVRSVVMLAVLYVLFSFMELLVLWLVIGKVSRAAEQGTQAACEPHLLSALLAANFMSTLSTNFDKILAYGSLTLRILGGYTFASQLAALLFLFVNAAVAAFTPKFRELSIRKNHDEVRRFLILLSTINNFLILAGAVLFVMNADFFLRVFSGHLDRIALVHTFSILAAAVLISSNLWFPGAIATSSGKAHFSVYTNLGFLASYLCAFFILRGRYHETVFSVAMLCAATLTTAFGLVYFKVRVLDFSLLRYLATAIGLPLLVVGVTYYLPAFLIKQILGGVLPGVLFAAAWLVAVPLAAFRGKNLFLSKAGYAL